MGSLFSRNQTKTHKNKRKQKSKHGMTDSHAFSFKIRIGKEMIKLNENSVNIEHIDSSRHWILEVNNNFLYIGLPDGYPFSAPIVTFAKIEAPESQTNELRYTIDTYLDQWHPTLYLSDLANFLENQVFKPGKVNFFFDILFCYFRIYKSQFFL